MKKSILLPLALLGGALVGSMLTAGVYTHKMSRYQNYYDKVETCLRMMSKEDFALYFDVIVETDYYQSYVDAREEVEK